MVSTTPVYELPFQTGTDRPCDAPGVWCEFVDIIDSVLFAIDQPAKRLSPAIPAAQVTNNVGFSIDGAVNIQAVPIPFESVSFDTDNMVDLTRSAFEIKPTREGNYLAVATMTTQSTVASVTSSYLGMSIGSIPGNEPVFGFGTESALHLDPVPQINNNAIYYHRLAVVTQWVNTNLFGISISATEGSSSVTLLIETASLSVYWLSDL